MNPRVYTPLPRSGRARAFGVLLCMSVVLARGVSAQPAAGDVSYTDLAPLIAERCLMCHSSAVASAGLRLDSYDAILKGSAKGPVVKAGDVAGSELMRRIKGASLPRMPMTGPPWLADADIARFERWVAGGLRKGDGLAAAAVAQAPAPLRPRAGEPVTYRHVAPILAARCAKCHTDKGLMGPPPEGYRLTSYEATLSTTDRVRVVPGRPEASELVRRIRGQALPRMPHDGPPWLSAEEIKLIETWVAQGARNADGEQAAMPVGARLRLHGTLGPKGQLDALELTTTPHTRIDKAPRPGAYVEVRGRIDAGGGVVVERMRAR